MSLAHPDDLVAALRDYGLVVVEDPGWRARGTSHPFDPFAQLFHHDALSEAVSDARALDIMRDGRPDLSGPLCNGWIDSDSRVVLVAYGNANHAGRGEADVLALLKAGQPPLGDARVDPDGDGPVGNSHLWGWECRNAGNGVDVWEQLDAMERAGAALADVCGWSTDAIAGHKEWTARKPDPAGIDMHLFRGDVARIYLAHHQEADLDTRQNQLLEEIHAQVVWPPGTPEDKKNTVRVLAQWASESSWAALGGVNQLLGRPGADVDEEALAAALAATVPQLVLKLSDEDLDRVAQAVNDEGHRRSAG